VASPTAEKVSAISLSACTKMLGLEVEPSIVLSVVLLAPTVVGGAHVDSPFLALVHPIRSTHAWHAPYS
jgi:hypothetical protein